MTIFVQLILGLILLVVGAEGLVRGASRLAAMVGVSPLVIGLTVVAYGTSSPEMAVSVRSGVAGQADIALGNVVGSNIFNVLFILGMSALITPLVVSRQLIRRDVPIMIGVSALLWVMSSAGYIGWLDGLILVTSALVYTIWTVRQSRHENQTLGPAYNEAFGAVQTATPRNLGIQAIYIIAGLVLLVIGANQLVEGAVALARLLGLTELVIGLTIIAAGTSLPEVATSVVASLRGERDIAVGNVVGSNIFNILAVLGLAAAVSPAGVRVSSQALAFDIPVMVAVAAACLPIFFTGWQITRWEGGLFLLYYGAYTVYLIFLVTKSPSLGTFGLIMGVVVIPATLLVLLASLVRSLRGHPRFKALTNDQ